MDTKEEFMARLDGSLNRKITQAYMDGFENGFHERDAGGTCDPVSSCKLWRSFDIEFDKQSTEAV